MMQRVTRRTGFTLMEVLIVVAIIVMLAGGALMGYTAILKKQEIKITETRIEQTRSAVEIFKADMKRYPSADKGLEELVVKPDDEKEAAAWTQYMPRIPVDAWNVELRYELTENSEGDQTFRVYSCGPDRTEGTPDDISIPPKE